MNRVAEIIESSTTGFTAECYELYELPAFGSLVKTANPPVEIFAVVCQAGTSSIEPGRHPIARGKGAQSESDIYDANPQLSRLLRSEFQALVVGHGENANVRQFLPARPARIHAFVHVCTPDEVKAFGQSFDFLNLLLSPESGVPPEELVAAVLRHMSSAQDDPRAFLVAAGKALAPLLGGQYQRLRAIIERIRTAK